MLLSDIGKMVFTIKQPAKGHFCPFGWRLLRDRAARSDMIRVFVSKNKIDQQLPDQ
jgi:hypothetical protein